MVASVEAIFLSTFILITQNRMAAQAQQRADLDLQISLLAEHEITRLLTLTVAIAERLGRPTAQDPELAELAQDVTKNPAGCPTACCGEESGQPVGLLQSRHGLQSKCPCRL